MRIAISNFTGGEVSASLSARYDLSRYKNSVQCMENFLPNVHGNVERRSGTQFIADVGGDAVLFPFSFNVESEHNFIIIALHKLIKIANINGLIEKINIISPREQQDLSSLSFAQVADIIYFAHSKYPLHKLMRSGSAPDYNWELQEVALNTSLSAPNTPAVSFAGGGTGYTLRYKVVAVDANGKESLPSEAGSVNGKHPSDWVVGNYSRISWASVADAVEYNIYREEAGYFGFIGISDSLSFVDNNYEADIADTPREDWDPFADGNNPAVVTLHQQRMVLASTPNSPQSFYMSRIGDFENFRKSRPMQEDDPVEYLLASGNVDAITWVASFGEMLVGTSGSEYKVSGNGAAITVSNVSVSAQSYWGSSTLFPIIIGNSILHVQRHGSRVRDLFYSLEKDGYAGNDLSIMAPHLFDGYSLKQWAFQQTPNSSIWIVRNDGVLLALTYMKEHDIWGWSRHITQGKVRSVATISGKSGDDIYFIIQREIQGNIRYYLERLSDKWQEVQGLQNAFFIDSGKTQITEQPTQEVINLEHLEGCQVSILADGSPIEDLSVHDGKVALPYPANIVHVGLSYTSAISPLPTEGDLQSGTSLAQMRGIGQCHIRLQGSVGGKYGSDRDNLYDFPHVPKLWGETVEPFNGDISFIPGGGQSTNSTLWLVQDTALPFNIAALVINVDIIG